MTPARTTVVIATRNRCAELSRTLGELAALRPRPPVIVVDNDSEDATAEMVAEMVAALPHDVRLVRLSHNAGATARNVGVAMAETPYVAFSDDDSWWAPGALPRAEHVFDAHPALGLLAARTLVGPDEHEDPVSAEMARSPLGRGDLPGPSVLGFLACSAVVRRQAFLDAGGFSSVLHFAGEETLLAYDLAATGWQLCYVDDVCAHHHPSAVRGHPVRREARQLRNQMLVTWMRRPMPVAVRASVDLLRRTVRHPPAALAAAATALRLPMALAHRHRLPREVEHRIRVLEATP